MLISKNRKIIVRTTTGLGNELFQFAFAKNISEKLGVDLEIDQSFFRKFFHPKNLVHFKSELQFLAKNIRITDVLTSSFIGLFYKLKLNKYLKTITIPLPTFQKFVFIEDSHNIFAEINSAKDNTIVLNGYFQSHKINRRIVFKALDPKKSLHYEKIKKYYSNLFGRKFTSSIHIRRGDYLSNEKFSKIFSQINSDYYEKSIRLIEEKVNKSIDIVLVFSDDIKWVKKNFTLNKQMYFVDYANPQFDFLLMTMCNANIIANSTFSYWAALLNSHACAVCYPGSWFQDRKNDIYFPKSWLKII